MITIEIERTRKVLLQLIMYALRLIAFTFSIHLHILKMLTYVISFFAIYMYILLALSSRICGICLYIVMFAKKNCIVKMYTMLCYIKFLSMHVNLINGLYLQLTIPMESNPHYDHDHHFMALLCKRSADMWAKSKSGYMYRRCCLFEPTCL